MLTQAGILSVSFKNFLLAFTALFVALDIVGTLPIFVSMTHHLESNERSKIVNTSMTVALIVALAFVFLGKQVFRFLGIEMFDFRIAGGLILLLVSLADLVGKPEYETRVSGSTGVVPFAMPLITGPAILTTSILQVGAFGYLVTVAALVSNYLLAWVLLRNSQRITRVLGKDGTTVVSKIAALLLAAIAVAMIRSGLFEAIRSV